VLFAQTDCRAGSRPPDVGLFDELHELRLQTKSVDFDIGQNDRLAARLIIALASARAARKPWDRCARAFPRPVAGPAAHRHHIARNST